MGSNELDSKRMKLTLFTRDGKLSSEQFMVFIKDSKINILRPRLFVKGLSHLNDFSMIFSNELMSETVVFLKFSVVFSLINFLHRLIDFIA